LQAIYAKSPTVCTLERTDVQFVKIIWLPVLGDADRVMTESALFAKMMNIYQRMETV